MRLLSDLDPGGQHTAFLHAQEALDYALSARPDAVFLEIDLPDVSGLTLAKNLQEGIPSINLIFTTAETKYAFEAWQLYASAFLQKPLQAERVAFALHHLRHPVPFRAHRMRVQAFGNFEVFVDDKPLNFSRRKTKELFAYLVDRNGASVTSPEIAAILFEDKAYTRSLRSQVQTLTSDMMRTLRALDLAHVVRKSYNSLAVDTSSFACDYYDFLQGDAKAIHAFTGEYMSNYSWTEYMAGALNKRTETQQT